MSSRTRWTGAVLAAVVLVGQAGAAEGPPAVQVVRAPAVERALHEPQAASGTGRFATVARDADFSVVAVAREGPGKAEQHDRDTDVWYVVAGAGTLVTGGALVDPVVTGPGERRGTSIRGGEEHALAAGDVITVRRGVPHWVKAVEGSLRYLTVKVRR